MENPATTSASPSNENDFKSNGIEADLVKLDKTSESIAVERPELAKPDTDDSIKQNETEKTDTVEYVTGWKLLAVIGTVTAACFIMLLDNAIIATAIPRITSDFHSLSDVGWYGSSYLISNCTLQPLTGKIYGQFNSKWTFLAFLAIFELGSLICGASVSSAMLIIGRSIAGLGGAGLTNGGLTIISACVPLEKRAFYLGILMSIAQMGILLGPVIGGALTTYATWRWCFYINLPIGGVVAAVLCFVHIPQSFTSQNQNKKTAKSVLNSLDPIGFCLFAPTAVTFLLALQWGGTAYSWDNVRIIVLFCLSGVLLAVFLFWEYRRGITAMIPLSILKIRFVYCGCLGSFFLFSGLMISAYYIPIYFQAVQDVSAVQSGVYTLPGVLPQMLAAVISGYLVGRLGYYLPWGVGSGVVTAIAYGLLSTLNANTSTAKWVIFQIIGGIGRGCGLQMSLLAVQRALPLEHIPVGVSLVVFFQNLGGAFSLAVVEAAFSQRFTSFLRTAAPGIDPKSITDAGAANFRGIVPEDQLEIVLSAYSAGIDTVFYVATGMAFGALLSSSGTGFKSVKAKKNDDNELEARKSKD